MHDSLITSAELAKRLNYTERHVREYLRPKCFIEGIHYVRLPGSRKILYSWDNILKELFDGKSGQDVIPMANGGYCNG